MSRNNVRIVLDGKDGIFTVEKRLSLFVSCETQKTIVEQVAAIKKQVTSMSKFGDVMIDLCETDVNCRATSKFRLIIRRWDYNGTFELDQRKFNGYDFADSTKLQFVSVNDRNKYLYKFVNKFITETMGELPIDKSFFSQKLNNTELPNDVIAFVN